MLGSDVLEYIDRSVLCWLATVDSGGYPNVSPKEIFCHFGNENLLIANIASPGSSRNILSNSKVCVSFVDIFVQKGYKIKGEATIVEPSNNGFDSYVRPLLSMTKGMFKIRSIFDIRVELVERILAPSYILEPNVTEQDQVKAALKTYGVEKSNLKLDNC